MEVVALELETLAAALEAALPDDAFDDPVCEEKLGEA